MERQIIYLETSVVSYLTSRPSTNLIIAGHQAATRDFWDQLPELDCFVSELVIQEAGRGDRTAANDRLEALEPLPELEINADCKALAKALVADQAIPQQFPEDALHIAIAAVHRVDVIVTWNFKHINNPATRGKIRQSIERQGYSCPEICSPDEFMGGEDG